MRVQKGSSLMPILHQPEFKDGDIVMYESTTGKLLGPFEVYFDENGPDLFGYKDPAMVAEYGDNYFGEHVHGIIGDRVITVGWPKDWRIDPSRLRHITVDLALTSPTSTR